MDIESFIISMWGEIGRVHLYRACFGLIVVLGVTGVCVALSTMWKRIRVTQMISIGTGLFIAVYVIVSGMLLWADIFSPVHAAISTLLLSILFCVLRYKYIVQSIKDINWSLKGDVILLVGICVCAVFSSVKSESIAPTFDAGGYGQKALVMISGKTSVNTHLQEFDTDNAAILESSAELRSMQNCLYNDLGSTDMSNYQYHALPVWPAVLAMWGSIFGTEKMAGVLTLLSAIATAGLYFVIEQIAIHKSAKYLALCFGFLPLIIFLAKDNFAEPLYYMLLIVGVLLILQEYMHLRYCALIPLWGLGLVHAQFLIYIPAIYAILICLAIARRDPSYTKIAACFGTLSIISLLYEASVSPTYIRSQFINFIGSRIAPIGIFLAAAVILFFIFFSFLLSYTIERESSVIEVLNVAFEKYLLLALKFALAIVLGIGVVKCFLMGFTDFFPDGISGTWSLRQNYRGTGASAILRMNLVVMILVTGGCVPYLLYKCFSRKTKWRIESITCAILFIYALAVDLILRTDSPKLYYAARYFAIASVPAVVLLTATLIDKKRTIVLLGSLCIITSLPLNIVLLCSDQHAEMWGSTEDLLTHIPQRGIVYLDSSYDRLAQVYPTTLRMLNDNLVYYDAVVEEVRKERSGEEYFVTETEKNIPGLTLVFKENYVTSGEIFSISGMPPLLTTHEPFDLFVYKADWNWRPSNLVFTGLGWTQETEASIHTTADFISQYGLEIQFYLPGEWLGITNAEWLAETAKVYLNGQCIREYPLQDGNQEIVLQLTEEDIYTVDTEEYEITLTVPGLFVPAEVLGTSDERSLGINFRYVGVIQ